MKEARVVAPTPSRVARCRVPGDKSISHRAALLAVLAEGTSRIGGFSTAGDCRATLHVLEGLGVTFALDAGILTIRGGRDGLKAPRAALDCRRSGTTMRLTAGLVAGGGFETVLTGDRQLLRRPMARVSEPLRAMGATVQLAAGETAPINVRGGDLSGITYELPVASAQVKSAVLLAGVQASGMTTVIEHLAARDHTERLLKAMRSPITRVVRAEGISTAVRAAELVPLDIDVPGDLSSAAVIVAAAVLTGSELIVEGVGLNPTRTGFLEVLKRMGAHIETTVDVEDPEPAGELRARSGPLSATRVMPAEIPSLIDELPLLGVVATQAEGTTEVLGAGELRAKESDRIAGLVVGLRALGADAEQLEDGFVVRGPTPLTGGA
ncbi:MAG: 3-phosphoshikimate 1-carboxyvinyltransferase, partial [Actinomycetota bacterium]|nr:3-phosphoshikimate 1-carboxyvinyltransferase [Actinomycetota bacterium]